MTRVVLRGFATRKLRAVLTGIAIALGVALMAGTYVLTDTINSSFASIFSTASRGHDVVITPHQALGRNTQSQISPVDDAVLARVRAVPGVAAAAGSIFAPGSLLGDSGKRLTAGGAPAFVTAVAPARFQSFSPVAGRLPRTADEVTVDQATAGRAHLHLGQSIQVAGSAPAHRYAIVGFMKFAGSQNFGGASAAMLTLSEAQRVAGYHGQYDQVDIAARPGVSDATLRERIRAVLPAALDVRTGAQQAAKNTSDLEANLGFLRTFLLIFAYVALVVGAFIIFNTFSITVAQRTREFGLLRTLGASRRQVMQSVVVEGLLLGALGSVIGLFGGLALAPALDQLFKSFGADLPDSGNVLEARTVIVSLAVGIAITVAAGFLPALRATRVPPIAAMREGVGLPPRKPPSVRRLVIQLVVRLVLIGLLLRTPAAAAPAAAIAFAWFGVRMRRRAHPRQSRLIPALARALGVIVAWRGVTGRLARENTIRQPGRTAVTAAALTVGLALVTLFAILAAGTKASINQAVDRSFAGDLIVDNSSANSDLGIPPATAPLLRAVSGVARVTPVDQTQGRVSGIAGNTNITGVQPRTLGPMYRIRWQHGSGATLAGLGPTQVIITKIYASAHHLGVGRTLAVLTPRDRTVRLTVAGVASDAFGLLKNLTITRTLAQAAFGQRDDIADFVAYAPGASGDRVKRAVDRLLAARFPQAHAQTAAQFKRDQASQVNTLLTLIYVLLALSILISLFGIVNTLVLSIYERTRELGMLRSIGASRRQLRQMIDYESLITALIGGVLGLTIGVVGGVIASVALASKGFVLSIPVLTLAIMLIAAGVVGLLAAQLPARRAGNIDVLRALTAE